MAYKLYKTKYITSQGETWDIISEAFYGTPYKVSDLIACNPEYSDVLVFEDGTKLNVPILQTDSINTLPPWKRGSS